MFGHQDDSSNQTDDQAQTEPALDTGNLTPPLPTDTEAQPAVSVDNDWQHPGIPLPDKNQEVEPISDVVSPAGGFPRSTDNQAQSHRPIDKVPPPDSGDLIAPGDSAVSDLVEIRQHALTELAPLLDQLDLKDPEERFRTIMMVIQASDDRKLVKEAYEAAHAITDEKAKAQALLDVVNEVNYFTQQSES
jgi:hypothetical protein